MPVNEVLGRTKLNKEDCNEIFRRLRLPEMLPFKGRKLGNSSLNAFMLFMTRINKGLTFDVLCKSDYYGKEASQCCQAFNFIFDWIYICWVHLYLRFGCETY